MTSLRTLLDPSMDDRIRSALRAADKRGKLGVVSAVAGPSVETLREIMNSTGELDTMDRGMLAVHLFTPG